MNHIGSKKDGKCLAMDVRAPEGAAAGAGEPPKKRRRRFGLQALLDLLLQRSADAEGPAAEVPTEQSALAAITRIYREFQQSLWRKVHRTDVEPESAVRIHQETFLNLYDFLLRTNNPPLEKVEAMLTTIVGHLICNHRRVHQGRRKHARLDASVDVAELAETAPDPDQRVSGVESKALVEVVLGRLPERDAALIRLLDLEEMPAPEVAEAQGIPVTTLHSRHKAAKGRFAAMARSLYTQDDLGGVTWK